MPDNQDELIQKARQAFLQFIEISDWVSNRPQNDEDMEDILDELYSRGLDVADPTSYSISWGAVKSQRKTREAREEKHRHFREEYLSPAADVREAVIAEFSQQQKPVVKPVFVPEKQYSDEEIDKMSSDEYRRKIVGELRIEDRQEQSTVTAAPERPRRKPPTSLRAINKALERF